MAISTTHLKRCDLIKRSGRFDSNTAPELQQALNESIEQAVYRVVLDMEEVTFFGSAAIRALVMAYKTCRRWNRGDVRLSSVPDNVKHVLDLAGIAPLVEVFDDTVEAVGSF